MAEVPLSGIEFEIKGSTAAAVVSIDRLRNALAKLQGIKIGDLGLKSAASQIKNFVNAVNKLDMSKLETFAKSVKGFSGLAGTLDKISKDPGAYAQSFGTLYDYLSQLSEIDFTNLTEASSAIKSIAASADAVGKIDAGSAESVSDKASAWDRLKLAMLGVAKAGGKLISLPFASMGKSLGGVASKLGDVLRQFKRIVGYRVIRSIIREITQGFSEGVKAVYQWSKIVGGPVDSAMMTFAQSMDDIATSLKYFKNGIGAAVAPLISALAPAIRAATDAAVEFLNVINQLMALLTGKSGWIRATRQAQEYEEAVGGAGGAAKEALRYLAPFDELNVLPSEKGGGGGGGAEDFGGMFEEMVEFEQGIIDFADRIKKAIEDSDWQGLGTLLGDKVNELVDKIDFASLGTTVGQKINALFSTQYWTLDTINFQNIGSKIAEFLNNALSNIDFEIIGRGFVQKFTILGDLIIGFINELDFGEVSTAISDWILGALQEAAEWIQDVDWSELMDNIIDGIVDFIANLKLGEILSAIGDVVGSIGGALVEMAFAVLENIFERVTDPDWWAVVWAWFKENIVEGFANLGINIANAIIQSIQDGLNNFANVWNDSDLNQWILDTFGWDWTIPAIEWELIPTIDIDSGYEEAKAAYEAKSKEDPMGLQAAIEEIVDKLPGDQLEVDVTGKVVDLEDVLSERDRIVDTTAHATTMDKSGLSSKDKTVDVTAQYKWVIKSALSEVQRSLGVTAIYKWVKKGELNSDQRSLGITGVYKWVTKGLLTGAQKTINTISQYAKSDKSKLTGAMTTISTTSKYTKTDFSALTSADRQIDSTALIKGSQLADNIKDPWGRVKIAATANIEGVTGQTTITMIPQANGGVFTNSGWKPITSFAGGGFPYGGQIFRARENGNPELVGTLNGSTAVMNNNQIVASVSAGVARAIAGIRFQLRGLNPQTYQSEDGVNEDILYRAFSRALADADLGGDIELDGEVLYRSMVNRNRRNTRMTGVNALG